MAFIIAGVLLVSLSLFLAFLTCISRVAHFRDERSFVFDSLFSLYFF